jgi:hypothetical protein
MSLAAAMASLWIPSLLVIGIEEGRVLCEYQSSQEVTNIDKWHWE